MEKKKWKLIKIKKRWLILFLLPLIFPAFFFLFILFVISGPQSVQSSSSNSGSSSLYVEHWSTGDPYTHNLFVKRFGITPEQLDGYLDSTGIPYDKSRINGKLLLQWEHVSGVDVRAIVAIAQMESSFGTAGVATMPGANMFGYGAFDSNPENASNFNDETAVVALAKQTLKANKNETFQIQDEKARKYALGVLNVAVEGGVYFTTTTGHGKMRADVMEKLDKWIDEHGGTPPPPASTEIGIPNGEYSHIFNVPYTVLQPYGYTAWSTGAGAYLYAASGGRHTGVDVVADGASMSDVPVLSMTNGTVYSVFYTELGGHAIIIETDFGGYVYYGHNKYASTLSPGQKVNKGDKIAVLGHSGMTDIYHVHLEYSTSPQIGMGFDRDPSFLFQKSGTLQINQKIFPK